MDRNQIIAIIILVLGAVGFIIWWLFYGMPESRYKIPSKEESEQEELQGKRGSKKEEFISTFGFEPGLLSQDRYKKEVLIKLGLLAEALQVAGQEALKNPGYSYYRGFYDERSASYSEMLQLIGLYDAEFQRNIPHWTELPVFAHGWLDGKKTRNKNSKATVECD